jgi:capsular exopolysaccharide synthesis family protein
LLVTSAEPQEGKTTIVANLAYTLAESGRQVVAVDCDLRRPRLHATLNLTNEIGLSSVLQQQATLDAALHLTEFPGLQVLSAGPSTPKPAELLGSRAMTDLIGELRQRFDLVLLDTPAIAAVTDAAILAPLVDGVLLVVRRAKAREEGVRAACQQLAGVGARPIGVVLNRARQEGSYYYYQYSKQADRAHASDS